MAICVQLCEREGEKDTHARLQISLDTIIDQFRYDILFRYDSRFVNQSLEIRLRKTRTLQFVISAGES